MALALAVPWLHAQSPSQLDYVYDAAGNLVGVTRSPAVMADLTVTNLTVGTIVGNGNGSFSIPVSFQVNNVGTGPAVATWYDRGYLSTNGILENTDQALGGYNTRTTNLAAGGSYTVVTTFITNTTSTPGNYTLIVKADGGAAASGQYSPIGVNYVRELNELNNTQSAPIVIPVPVPDLAISNASIGAITVFQNGSYKIPVTFTVSSVGTTLAPATWYDLAYLSTDATLDNADQNLGGYNTRTTGLAAGASYTTTINFTTTTATAPGTYTLFLKTDGRGSALGIGTNTDNGYLAEASEANNTQALPITLPIKPDLTLSNASIGTIVVNQNGSYKIPVTFTVNNVGGAAAQPIWYDVAYLSTDATLDNSDQNLANFNQRTTALAAGANYTATVNFTTTTATAAGNYTLFVKADGRGSTIGVGTNTDNGYVTEANDANNTQALTIALPVKPDLTVSNLSVGTIVKNANASYTVPVTFTVNNVGGAAAQPSWYTLAYLSADATLDNSDQNLAGYHQRTTALAAGTSYTATVNFTTTTTMAAGTYTLFVKADGRGSTIGVGTNTDNGVVTEASEANNTASVVIVLP